MSRRKISEEENRYLRENYSLPLKELAAHFGISIGAVVYRAHNLGLSKNKPRRSIKCDYDCFNCIYPDCIISDNDAVKKFWKENEI